MKRMRHWKRFSGMLFVLLLAVGFLPLLPAVTVRAATTYQANNEALLKQAAEGSEAGDTVELSGEFALSSAVSIKQGVTLCVTANTVLTGNKTQGLILKEGARLICSDQASLSMKGFQTALMIEKGAEVGDGTYVLDGNEYGFNLKGSFRGSSREKLRVSAVSENGRAFTYSSDSLFCRCTVRVVAENESSEQYSHLNLKDASLTTKGVWYYFNPPEGKEPADTPVLSMDHAEFYAYKATGASAYRHTMGIMGRARIVNGSRLTSDGSRITVATKVPVEVEDSELVLKNSSAGGLNINYKNSAVILKNSTITGENLRYTPLFGTAYMEGPASIRFLGDCVVNTPARNRDADNGGANRGNQGSYIVTGGSYLVAYDPGYNHDVTTPTNGPEHGDEWLSLFTLTDSSQALLHPIDKNGMPYDYSVKKATRDGKKHVWTPEVRVFYQLSNGNAVFPDGTTKDKTASTIRGYRLQDVEGNVSPGTPKDKNGRTFLGWYYRDETGEEHAFDETLPLTDRKERIVYAKWDINMVVYHQNIGRLSYTESVDPTVTDASALSMEAVEQQVAGFLPPGKRFRYWTENPDGTGEQILPGKPLHFNPLKKRYDLYAQYQVLTYTVAFSANGGRFSDASVYKTHPEVFEILEDPNGGEVARLKKSAEYGTKLRTLLDGLDYNLLKPDVQAEKPGFLLNDATRWKTDPEGAGSIRFDDYKIFFFKADGANPAITADTTYYLSWKMDDNIGKMEQSFPLDGDVWGKSSAESKKTQVVKATEAGKGFRLTCGLNVATIKDYMNALPDMLSVHDPADYESIRLFGAQSEFTAVLKLPEGVVVPDKNQLKVTADGLGSCFEKTRSTLSGKTLTIVFDLKDGMTNFQRLHDAVFSTGGAGAAQGTAASDDITVTVEGLSLDSEKVTDGQKLKIIGTLKGSFSAVAVKGDQKRGFVFHWKGKQSESGRDENSDPGSEEITYTIQVLKPMDISLPADILSDGETENREIYPVLPGTVLPFTGALKVSSIREQMKRIEDIYPDHAAHPEQLKIQVSSCTFTAKFTLPDGLEYPEDVEHKLITENFGTGGEFTISETRRDGQKLTVRMKLKDGIQNYKQLQEAVAAAGRKGDDENDWMRLTVPGVKVKPGAAAGTKFTVTGTISGEMDATATAPSGEEREFLFAWHGEQWDPGRDFVLEGDPSASRQAIQFTLMEPEPIQGGLPGDILIGDDTEHEAVYPVYPGETLCFTGALDIRGIQQKMKDIERDFQNPDPNKIMLSDKEFGFTATFTVPEGMSLSPELKELDPDEMTPARYEALPGQVVRAEAFGSGFQIRRVKKSPDGKSVQVEFGLKDADQVTQYTQLQKIVQDAGEGTGWMKIILPGVKVSEAAAPGTQHTVSGTVEGFFSAVAKMEPEPVAAGTAEPKVQRKRKAFRFQWNAVQWDGGRDFAAEDPNDPSIRFTAKVRGKTGVLNLKKIVAGEAKKQSEERFAIRIWADSPLTGAYPALAESEQTGGGAAVRRKVEFVPAEHEKRGEDGTDYVSYAEVELKAGEAVSIGGLPDGLGYFVEEEITEEQARQGYEKEYQVFQQEGRIAGERAAFVLIVNYRQHQGQEVIIKKQWKNDEEQMRPKCLHFRLVPHRGSADGEVFPSIPQEEITMYPEQGFWYASKVVPMLASMSNAETRSNASNSVAEAVKGEVKRYSHSDAAVGSNADAGKRTPSETDLLDENGNLADGLIFNDILNRVGALLGNTWNEWSEKLFQQEAIIWTLEETDVPDGYTPEIGEGTWENGALHFVVTNRYQKDQPNPDPKPNVTPEPEPNVTPGHGGHGHGKGGEGGFVIRRTPAPSEPPVPSVQDHMTEHPSGYEAVSEGSSSSGALPKTGEALQMTGEALQMTGTWSLSGLVLLLYALFLKLRRR